MKEMGLQGGRPTLCGVGWPRVTSGPQSLSIQRNITLEDHHHWFEVDSRSMVQMDGHTDPWTHHFHIGSPNVIKLCTQGLHKRDYRAKDGVLHLSWAVGWSKALLPDHPRKLHYLNFGHMQRSTKLIDPSYAWWGILIQGWRGVSHGFIGPTFTSTPHYKWRLTPHLEASKQQQHKSPLFIYLSSIVGS
jgi:hypothetical protein